MEQTEHDHKKKKTGAAPEEMKFDQLSFLQQLIALLFMPMVEKAGTSNNAQNSLFAKILGFDDTKSYTDWHHSMAKSNWDWKNNFDFGKTDFHSMQHSLGHAASADTGPPPKTVLDLVAKYESHGDYNVVYGNHKVIAGGQERKLTDMTINEVLDWQKDYTRHGSPSSAAGRYQMLHATLEGLTQGMDRNQKFDEKMQDQLATKLLERRGYSKFLNGEISDTQFMHNLSQEWASLPKDSSGLSFYAGDGLNHAGVRADTVLTALNTDKASRLSHAGTLDNNGHGPSATPVFASAASPDSRPVADPASPRRNPAFAPAPVVS